MGIISQIKEQRQNGNVAVNNAKARFPVCGQRAVIFPMLPDSWITFSVCVYVIGQNLWFNYH